MVREEKLEPTEARLVPASAGWFVMNARNARYCADETAARYNASSPEDTQDGALASAPFAPSRPTGYRAGSYRTSGRRGLFRPAQDGAASSPRICRHVRRARAGSSMSIRVVKRGPQEREAEGRWQSGGQACAGRGADGTVAAGSSSSGMRIQAAR